MTNKYKSEYLTKGNLSDKMKVIITDALLQRIEGGDLEALDKLMIYRKELSFYDTVVNREGRIYDPKTLMESQIGHTLDLVHHCK